jgi:hypothetical protein
MNKEDKKLLLKDLCGRLPYVVKCTTKSLWNGIYTIEGYKDDKFFLDCPVYDEGDDEWMIESIVPYLRPMSSMTEEEEAEIRKINRQFINDLHYPGVFAADDGGCTIIEMAEILNFLNANYFDYRGLIEMGLALEAPEGMYDNK